MKLAIVGYAPPPSFKGATQFHDNIQRFDRTHELILYSEHPWPGAIQLARSPDQLKQSKNKWTLSNAVFFAGLKIAMERDLDYMLYMEADSRVGCHHWDKVIIDEAMAHGPGDIVAWGSVVCYAPCNHTIEYMRRWQALIADANGTRRNFPVPTYGAGGSLERTKPCLLVNGAVGVYNVKAVAELLPGYAGMDAQPSDPPPKPFVSPFMYNLGATVRTPQVKYAEACTAWDWEIGKRLFDRHDTGVFDLIKLLGSVYSSYGDVITTEEDRQNMLLSGEFVAVHQVKSEWPGPLESVEPKAKVLQVRTARRRKVVMDDPKPKQPIKKAETPKVGIMIVSYLHDREWLGWCLRSIEKFASGHVGVMVCLPKRELNQWDGMGEFGKDGVRTHWFDEVEGNGHMSQCWMKMCADVPDEWLVRPTHILHMDSDCVFTKPADVIKEYFANGKPVLMKERYDRMTDKNRYAWKAGCEKALGFPIEFETMCRNPAIYPMWMYSNLRDHVEESHKTPFKDYVMSTEKPGDHTTRSMSEFVTIGNYALKFHEDKFFVLDVTGKPQPANPMKQFWSYKSVDVQNPMGGVKGSPVRYFRETLGL